MKTWLLLLACLLAVSSQAQTRREVYQWRDADGVTHFSDYPQPGARKIILNGAPTTTTATPASAAAATRSRAQPAATEMVYDRLEIWTPENECLVLRARYGNRRPGPCGTDGRRSGPPGDLRGWQAVAGGERPGTPAHRHDAGCAHGDECDLRQGRQGKNPQHPGRVSHEATVHTQSAQPGSGRAAAATPKGRLTSRRGVNLSRLPGSA